MMGEEERTCGKRSREKKKRVSDEVGRMRGIVVREGQR